MQPTSDRLGPLLNNTTPRRFTDQHGSSTARQSGNGGLFGAELPKGSRQSQSDQHSVEGVGYPHDDFQRAQHVSAKLLLNQGQLSQKSTEASWPGSSKARRFLPMWGSAAQDKLSSNQQNSEWSLQTDSSVSKLHTRASFSSGTLPATTALQAYRSEANPSDPSLMGGKTAGTASCKALDQPSHQAIQWSSLISTRFSEQSSLGDVHHTDLGDALSVQPFQSETPHAAQQVSHSEQWQLQHLGRCSSSAGDLYSAVSVQPRRSRPSLLADTAAKSTKACALSEDLQPEPCLSAQAESVVPVKSLAGQSPVAIALLEDSPWDDQPGSLHLRRQSTWHLPSKTPEHLAPGTTSQSHTQLKQQQQQQQLLNQHLSVTHSLRGLSSAAGESLLQSAADNHAPTAGSEFEPDSMPAPEHLSFGGLTGDVSAGMQGIKVC